MLTIGDASEAHIQKGAAALLLVAAGASCLALPVGDPASVRMALAAILLIGSAAEMILVERGRSWLDFAAPVSFVAAAVLLLLPVSSSAFSIFILVGGALLVRGVLEAIAYLRGAWEGRINAIALGKAGAALIAALLFWYAADTSALWEAAFDWPVRTVRLLAVWTGLYLALIGVLHLVEPFLPIHKWRESR
jgi:uncharacterized membrane protein HdeD (DUF308 family)